MLAAFDLLANTRTWTASATHSANSLNTDTPARSYTLRINMDRTQFNQQAGQFIQTVNDYNQDNLQPFPTRGSPHISNMLPSNNIHGGSNRPNNFTPQTMTNCRATGYIYRPHFAPAPLPVNNNGGFQEAFSHTEGALGQADTVVSLHQRMATLERDKNNLRAFNDRLLREGRAISQKYSQMRNFFGFVVTNGGLQAIDLHNSQYQHNTDVLRRYDYLIAHYQGLRALLSGDNDRNSTVPNHDLSQNFGVRSRQSDTQGQYQPAEVVDLTGDDDNGVAQNHINNATYLAGVHLPPGQTAGQATQPLAHQQASSGRRPRRRPCSAEASPIASSAGTTISPVVTAAPESSPPQVPDDSTSSRPPTKRVTKAEFWAKTERWQGPVANLHLAKALGMKPSAEYATEISNRHERDALNLNLHMAGGKKKKRDKASGERVFAPQKDTVVKPNDDEDMGVKGKTPVRIASKRDTIGNVAVGRPTDITVTGIYKDSDDLEQCFQEYFRDEESADVEDNRENEKLSRMSTSNNDSTSANSTPLPLLNEVNTCENVMFANPSQEKAVQGSVEALDEAQKYSEGPQPTQDDYDDEINEHGGGTVRSISPLIIEDGYGRPLPEYQESVVLQEGINDGLDYLF
ncbi:hypothetical protein RBB50_001508 [Rhinocladiella similis]